MGFYTKTEPVENNRTINVELVSDYHRINFSLEN
jgi:hypothetical protein